MKEELKKYINKNFEIEKKSVEKILKNPIKIEINVIVSKTASPYFVLFLFILYAPV